MARKTLLTESEIRQFMKLANIKPLQEMGYGMYEDELNCSMISIYENGPLSLREIAKREGLSFARIKQIQDKALIKLKKRLPDGSELLASSGRPDYLF